MNLIGKLGLLAAVLPSGAEAPAAVEPSGPTLFSALERQLGLRIKAQKSTVETLVIDGVDRPTEN